MKLLRALTLSTMLLVVPGSQGVPGQSSGRIPSNLPDLWYGGCDTGDNCGLGGCVSSGSPMFMGPCGIPGSACCRLAFGFCTRAPYNNCAFYYCDYSCDFHD